MYVVIVLENSSDVSGVLAAYGPYDGISDAVKMASYLRGGGSLDTSMVQITALYSVKIPTDTHPTV